MTNLQLVQDANFQIVHEVYDLLTPPDKSSGAFIRNDTGSGTEWLLMKPATTSPLRMLRFTQFKPIYKHGVLSVNHECTLTVTPILVTYDSSAHTYTFVNDMSGKQLYSNGYMDTSTNPATFKTLPVNIPIITKEYTFVYDGSFKSLSHNINDNLDVYFKDLYTTGKLYYNDGTNTYASAKVLNELVMDAVLDPAYNAPNEKLQNSDSGPSSLTSFNCDRMTEVGANNISLSFIWVELTHCTSKAYLIFSIDIRCNTHAYSINTGTLCQSLFDDAPPQNTYNSGGTVTWYGGKYDGLCTYDGNLNIETRALSNNNMVISLCSSYAGNLTGKIFTGENIYQTVNIETFPSSMYFPITIRGTDGTTLSYDILKDIYEQVSIAVDYVYLTY